MGVATDNNGKATISQQLYKRIDEGIFFSKPGYITTNGWQGRNYLEKTAALNVRINPGTTNFTDYVIFFLARGRRGSHTASATLHIPAVPTTITIKAIDNVVNTIYWHIAKVMPGPPDGSFKEGQINGVVMHYNGVLNIDS